MKALYTRWTLNRNLWILFVKEANKEGLKNIKTVLADDKGFIIPEQNADLFFLRNVFHHLEEPVQYFHNVKKFLKSDGIVAIVDYKERSLSFIGIFDHFTPEKVLVDTMEKSGFQPLEKFDFLQKQLFMIFKMA
jgi:SAM-dependent methyltransferase